MTQFEEGMKDSLAFALFRRARIDQVEKRRMDNGTTSNKSQYYDPDRDELTERQIKTSWAADGRMRAYWYLLAAEAMRTIKGEELTPLPSSLSCLQCRGTGMLYVLTEEGLEPRVAKAQDKLELQVCNACNGAGTPPRAAQEEARSSTKPIMSSGGSTET